MNMLDWILIGIGAFWVLRGLIRGAIAQVFGVAGILFGFIVACYKYEDTGLLITREFPSFSSPGPVAFVFLFLLTWFCIAVVGYWVGRFVRVAGLGFLDRLWGGMIGFCKAVLFAIAVVSILTLFSAGGNPSFLTHSALVPYVKEASDFIFKIAPERVQGEYKKKRKELERFLAEKSALPFRPANEPGVSQKGKSERKKE